MEKEQLKKIFVFLEEKEKQNPPFLWKHKNNQINLMSIIKLLLMVN